MEYDYRAKKLVVVVSNLIDAAVALNLVGHLGISLGANAGPGLLGRSSITDASGVSHLGIARYPLIVKVAKASQLRRAVLQGRADPEILVADYPRQMLETGHDDELNEALGSAKEDDLEYLGAFFYGPTVNVDAICHKLSLWRK